MHPISLNKNSAIPLVYQLYEAIKSSILSGKLQENDQLPATRILSEELGISRNTVMFAYEQLLIEGYLESRAGSGTFVSKGISNVLKNDNKSVIKTVSGTKETGEELIDFDIVTPDYDHFPFDKWKAVLRQASALSIEHFGYTNPLGIMEFRESIAEMLRKRKGLTTSPDQIIITSGTLNGIKSISGFLRQKEDKFIIENPCYRSISSCLREQKYELCSIPVDKNGMLTENDQLKQLSGPVLVTPSNHFPSGAVLPVRRRIDLIEYAVDNRTFIIENDYNSDFHYKIMPVQSMHFLDPEHVIHVGTFSETMFPSLRLGYIVLPENLINDFTVYSKKNISEISSVTQLAMMQFIQTGEYEKHLYKMSILYKRKRSIVISEMKRLYRDEIEICGDSSGLFLVVDFKNRIFEPSFSDEMIKNGIQIYTYNSFTDNYNKSTSKLLIGYGNISEKSISKGLKILKNKCFSLF